jgi:hypothetical protein
VISTPWGWLGFGSRRNKNRRRQGGRARTCPCDASPAACRADRWIDPAVRSGSPAGG